MSAQVREHLQYPVVDVQEVHAIVEILQIFLRVRRLLEARLDVQVADLPRAARVAHRVRHLELLLQRLQLRRRHDLPLYVQGHGGRQAAGAPHE